MMGEHPIVPALLVAAFLLFEALMCFGSGLPVSGVVALGFSALLLGVAAHSTVERRNRR